MRDRIIAQLEAAETRIKELEVKLERLHAGGCTLVGTPQPSESNTDLPEATPHRSKRRPQPRLTGFGSSSSLGQPLSSSFSSANLLSSRPRPSRQNSNLTPDREYQDPITAIPPGSGSGSIYSSGARPGPSTPSNNGAGSASARPGSGGGSRSDSAHHNRRRSLSTGSFGSPIHSEGGYNLATSRLGWVPGLETVSPGRVGWAPHGEESGGTNENENGATAMLDSAESYLRRLREVSRGDSADKGKGKERANGTGRGRNDEAWDCMNKLAGLLKRSDGLRDLLNAEEIIQV